VFSNVVIGVDFGDVGREAVAGKSISSADDVATVLATLSVGQKVKVTFTSEDGARSTVTVTLGRLAG
jgi:VCBS repeat-containing protein